MEKKDYKTTLNLPETAFPMKANLPTREPELIAFWDGIDIHARMNERNEGNPTYILHDGPPYANGHIHIGHALNKILKDIVVKYKSMTGHQAPYVPGWDCHGLPIEHQVDKKLGSRKDEIPITEKRLLCREYAQGFIDIQREEFKRLGVLGAWSNPYLTMAFPYEGRIIREFLDIFKSGYAYKGKKPVHWCASCVTALAEAEVEYADKTSPSVFVRFAASETLRSHIGIEAGKPLFAVIWTTTPWTLPANLALAVGEFIDYAAVDTGADVLIFADALIPTLQKRGIIPSDAAVVKRFKGSEIVGQSALHPFIERDSKIISADFVSIEEGSGIVHIAPGHGQDDYEAGLRHGLDILAPVNDTGLFEGTGVDRLEGKFVFKANEEVIAILTEQGALINKEDFAHSYPHCWRCKKPVLFRATEQWFISMKHRDLKKRCLEEIDRVRWVPHWGRQRIVAMVENRPDWCISRQRSWGVPIAVFQCTACGKLMDKDVVLDRVVEEFTNHGADVWYAKSAKELLPEGYVCPYCGHNEFEKETDILDVWFDSGVSHAATLVKDYGLTWPADMYLEGSDQHRGWFQSSLLASVCNNDQAPFRTVLTHGFAMDGKGKKMSKSLGNVVAPQDIINQTGAEILRLWVSAEDYRGDVRISKEIIARLTEAYRKIRNTAKYLLGNLSDFDGGDYSADLLEIDRWAVSRLQGLIASVTDAYEQYNFHEVYHRLYHFCIVDMSSFYLDILKDRLYTFGKDSRERRSAQWVLNEILLCMTRLMAPVLSFTAEEIWKYIETPGADKPQSVFLSEFPTVRAELINKELEARWARLIEVRNEVNKALEIKRAEKFIGNALEASVTVHIADDELRSLLEAQGDDLRYLFIVSGAKVTKDGTGGYVGTEVEGLSVTVELASGEKCMRCWNRSTDVGTHEDDPELCGRCHATLHG